MYQLREKNPPFGTAEEPLWEYAYSEQVKVVEGLCHVQHTFTRDYLLKIGYEEVKEEETSSSELEVAGVGANGHEQVSPPLINSRLSHRKKKRGR